MTTTITVSPDYRAKLLAFVRELEGTYPNVTTGIDTGRRYDRVHVYVANVLQALYFVDRGTEAIYGARSQEAPNLRRWYGTLATVAGWEWSISAPRPRDLAGIVVRTIYRGQYLYCPASE